MRIDQSWTDVANVVAETEERDNISPESYLVSRGLSDEDARQIVAIAGVDSMADLILLNDDKTVMELSKEIGLKIIPAKKLTVAVKALIEGANQEAATTQEGVEPSIHAKEQRKSSFFPDECIVVAIDRSGSMGSGFDEAKAFGANAEKTMARRSRMDAVKQCFYAFRDRTESLETKHHVGLIQFDNKIEEMLSLTDDLNKFEAIVDDMKQRGSTSIFSAIKHGCAMLKSVSVQSPKTDLRVLVLTDGQNNCGIPPEHAWKSVQEIGAVVDAIIVGDSPDDNLRKIVAVSGGTCFQIHSLSEGFELMEAESVVSLRSRRGGGDRPPIKSIADVEFHSENVKLQSIVSSSQASLVSSNAVKDSKSLGLVSASKVDRSMVQCMVGRRAVHELTKFVEADARGIHLYANRNDLSKMKALVEGPPETPFEGGVFLLDIQLPSDYPFKPPKVRFETPIFHCNVNSSGGMCLDILKDGWTPTLTIPKVLLTIRSLMADPNSDDALRPNIAELFFAYRKSGGKDARYIDQAQDATAKNASRSVQEWESIWAAAQSSGSPK